MNHFLLENDVGAILAENLTWDEARVAAVRLAKERREDISIFETRPIEGEDEWDYVLVAVADGETFELCEG